LQAGLGDEGVSEHKGGHFLRSPVRGMTVEQGSLSHVDHKLLTHHRLLAAFGIDGKKLTQEGSDALAPAGHGQGFCGQARQKAFGQCYLALTIHSDLGCQRIMHTKLNENNRSLYYRKTSPWK